MKVPKAMEDYNQTYCFMPVDHYLIDDDGNAVGMFPKPNEFLFSKQKFSKVDNIVWFINSKNIKEEWDSV